MIISSVRGTFGVSCTCAKLNIFLPHILRETVRIIAMTVKMMIIINDYEDDKDDNDGNYTLLL